MNAQAQNHPTFPSRTPLFWFNGVPVVVRPDFWPLPILVTGVLAWLAGLRKPERSWLQRLGVAVLAMPVMMIADEGHAMAHTVSARLAGAPMDEILFSSGMPRTLYADNDVPPRTHIQRSLGGLVFSLICFLCSLLWRRFSAPGSLNRDLADASLAGHSMILLGSIAPLPIVDGGTILKWKLVEAGQSPEQAEQSVRKTSIGFGVGLMSLGVLLGLSKKSKWVGGGLIAGGAAAIAAGKGWLK